MEPATTIRIPKTHPVASKLSPGECMDMNCQAMEPDEDEHSLPFKVNSAKKSAPPAKKAKSKSPIEYLKSKNRPMPVPET